MSVGQAPEEKGRGALSVGAALARERQGQTHDYDSNILFHIYFFNLGQNKIFIFIFYFFQRQNYLGVFLNHGNTDSLGAIIDT